MTAPKFPLHLVPTPGTALTGGKVNYQPGMLYRLSENDYENSKNSLGRSWIDGLSEADQLGRWNRIQIQVVEDHVARPGAALVRLRALADVPLQGSGRLAAGESIVLTAELIRQLTWLDPETQQSAYGRVVLVVEPINPEDE
ncbi:hypothetical protein ASG36_14635 [Geodermatophilus sp. Leaf369]|uniref:hypothetical protein n=1 Tax=Geodermatophilus sp. Leaf369 TaxID=1736354 RepID=UPI0006F49112|nr:hypothetical protein [Geodermatophilus sp. Leaf369]KQS57825.1 hypothetical protein ASG36_14635 [Geodermatophilus sp. Leaf369]